MRYTGRGGTPYLSVRGEIPMGNHSQRYYELIGQLAKALRHPKRPYRIKVLEDKIDAVVADWEANEKSPRR